MVLIATKSLTAHHSMNVGAPSSISFPGCLDSLGALVLMIGLFPRHFVFLLGQSTTLQTLPSHLMSWYNAGVLVRFLESGPSSLAFATSVPKEADVHAGQRICNPLYALPDRHLMIWLYVSNPESGGVSPGPIILSNTAHARRSSWIVSVASTAHSRVSKVHAGNLSRGVGPAWHDPLFWQHWLCARSRSSWPKTSAPSRSFLCRWHRMNANSSTIHRNILGLCPLRSVRHVLGGSSLVYVACIEVTYMLGGQPSPCGFLGHIIGHAWSISYISQGRGLVPTSPSNFLQVMLGRFTQLLLLCPPVGFSKGYPPPIGPMMTSLHFLPRLRLLWVSQPIRAAPTQMPFCACAMHSGRLLCPSFLFQLLKGKQLQFTEQLHTKHFVHHGSCMS